MRFTFLRRPFFPDQKNSIISEHEFHSLVDLERERAIRNNGFFSLLVLRNGNQNRGAVCNNLISTLKKRIRYIDELGWYDKERIGVILPQTTHEGAYALAADVQSRLEGVDECIEFSISTYPEKEKEDGRPPEAVETHSDNHKDLFTILGKPIPAWKRAVDIIGSLAATVLLIPIFLLIAVYIKIVSPGPVFFKQERLGYLKRPFTCWKFRTMKVDADGSRHKNHVADLIHNGKRLSKIDDEPDANIILFGNFLRKLGLDELPQLYNVLRGDMSLVGPRPCLDYEAAEFVEWQNRRFDVHPGLTGLWQVSGKNHTTFEEMMRLDIKYGQKRSVFQDILIFFKTFPAVLQQATESFFLKRKVDYER